jgi:hypothetical protein
MMTQALKPVTSYHQLIVCIFTGQLMLLGLDDESDGVFDGEGGNFMAISNRWTSAWHIASRWRGCSSLDPLGTKSSVRGSKNMSWNISELCSNK